MRKATNIIWDTDTAEEREMLPKEVDIPDGIEGDDIADWISDKYGWCISGYFPKGEKTQLHVTHVIARVENERKNITRAFRILHEDPNLDVEKAVIGAVTEWINTTEAGKLAWKNTANDFNWGDLYTYHIPMTMTTKYGFILICDNDTEEVIVVDHDQILYDKSNSKKREKNGAKT